MLGVSLLTSQQANAALSDALQELMDSNIRFPPSGIKLPRKELDLKFAVLLMRSTYDAVDDLDFTPMNQFQKTFWLTRRDTLDQFNKLHTPMQFDNGNLQDPMYFDFISFSQYQAVQKLLYTPKKVFEEYCGDQETDPTCPPSGKRTVARAQEFMDDSKLYLEVQKKTGDLIYDGLLNGFRGQDFGGPPPLPPNASIQQISEGANSILAIFLDRGYALQGSLFDVEGRQEDDSSAVIGSFRIKTFGGANLWGLQQLRFLSSKVLNAHDMLAIQGYLRSSGYRYKLQYLVKDNRVEQYWTILKPDAPRGAAA